uniref:ATP synthase subunit 8 n=1 Tax=Columbicola columbae TaxID=128991 RepID=A0A6G7SJH3_9NEOP|nr:ATP synthase subunit 8 [Columbicola columbae]
MPQMAPMFWEMFLVSFSIVFITFFVFIFFFTPLFIEKSKEEKAHFSVFRSDFSEKSLKTYF